MAGAKPNPTSITASTSLTLLPWILSERFVRRKHPERLGFGACSLADESSLVVRRRHRWGGTFLTLAPYCLFLF